MLEDDTPLRFRHTRGRNIAVAAIVVVVFIIFLSHMRPNIASRLSPPFRALSRPGTIGEATNTTSVAAVARMATSEMTATTSPRKDVKESYPHLSKLPSSLLPKVPSSSETPHDKTRRVIIIGDVHGHLKALRALLREAEFSSSHDTVIFTGDMVNKGADSAGVVELAMKIGAYGVRGNHEHRVLGAWLKEQRRQRWRKNRGKQGRTAGEAEDEEGSGEEVGEDLATKTSDLGPDLNGVGGESSAASADERDIEVSKTHAGDLATAASLKPRHRAWLSELPLMLRIGDLSPCYGDIMVVHAGLVPGLPLESQDPNAVMNMRTLLAPRHHSHSVAGSEARHDIQQQSLATRDDEDRIINLPLRQNPIENTEQAHQQEQSQSPSDILIPSPTREGKPWAKHWTSYQKSLPRGSRRTTVVYGHDAKAGLQMRRYAFGLDSGCGNGNRLTGVIFEVTPAADNGAKEKGGEDAAAAAEYEDLLEHEYEDDEDEGTQEGENEDEHLRGESHGKKRKPKKGPRIRHRLVSVSCAEAS